MNEKTSSQTGRAAPPYEAQFAASTLREAAADTRRSIRWGRAVGAALLFALSAWLSWLHAEIKTLDAESMASIAQHKARTALPGAAQELRAHLERSAPELVRGWMDHLSKAPGYLCARFERMADPWINRAAERLEGDVRDHLALAVETLHLELDRTHPGLDDREKFHLLVTELARDYREKLAVELARPSGVYLDAVQGLEDGIRELGRTEGLSEKERLQREILVTVLQLSRRAQMSGSTGDLPARSGSGAESIDR